MADHDRSDGEAVRLRDAAEEALSQLDWCIRYFDSIRQRRIAYALASNVRRIRHDLG